MNKIEIKNLEIFANHGVLSEEKTLGQIFLVSVDMDCDFSQAANNDDLNYTANYAQIANDIKIIMTENTFDLIETVADRIASFILYNYYNVVTKVNVKIKKPWAPVVMSLDTVSVSVERAWHTVYLGLGSNIGDLFKNLNEAIDELDKISKSDRPSVRLTKKSSFIQTAPVSDIEQPDYLNAVLEIRTTLSPSELIKTTLGIEENLGRERKEKWGPRIIDIDILSYDDLVTDNPIVTVPHPLMHKRLFVLEPFCEIAPNFVHPLLNKRIWEIKGDLEK